MILLRATSLWLILINEQADFTSLIGIMPELATGVVIAAGKKPFLRRGSAHGDGEIYRAPSGNVARNASPRHLGAVAT